jgi:hypothetical protein
MKLVAALAVVAALGVGVVGVAFAEGGTTTTRADKEQQFLDRLAQNTGVSTSQLQDGMRQTASQYVDDALANNKITQQQADQAKQRIAQSNGLDALRRIFNRVRGQRLLHVKVHDAIANALHMAPADLTAELKAGKNYQDVITEHGQTVDQVVNSVIDQAKTRLDKAVANNRLSADRETQMLDTLRMRLTDAINNGAPHAHANAQPSS